jgi:outer membrane protein
MQASATEFSKYKLLLTLVLSSAVAPAYSAELNVGIGSIYGGTPYRDYENEKYILPIINYDSDLIFVRMSSAIGVYFLKNDNHKFSLDIAYSPINFKPSRSDDKAIRQLDKRRAALLAGPAYEFRSSWGEIRTTVVADISGNSHGLIVDSAYSYPMNYGRISIAPSVGGQWRNAHYNNHFFGVNAQESQRSGLAQYSASGNIASYAMLYGHYRFSDSWSAFLMGKMMYSGKASKDSPMTENDNSWLVATGILYKF